MERGEVAELIGGHEVRQGGRTAGNALDGALQSEAGIALVAPELSGDENRGHHEEEVPSRLCTGQGQAR